MLAISKKNIIRAYVYYIIILIANFLLFCARYLQNILCILSHLLLPQLYEVDNIIISF